VFGKRSSKEKNGKNKLGRKRVKSLGNLIKDIKNKFMKRVLI
jgi:hypothetical protein